MTLALPSSPHWAPTTTVTGMARSPDEWTERASIVPDRPSDPSAPLPIGPIPSRGDGHGDAADALGGRWTRRRAPRCAPAGSPTSSIPTLRASIAALIEDVRDRGDAAVCDALARFDGIDARRPTSCG